MVQIDIAVIVVWDPSRDIKDNLIADDTFPKWDDLGIELNLKNPKISLLGLTI